MSSAIIQTSPHVYQAQQLSQTHFDVLFQIRYFEKKYGDYHCTAKQELLANYIGISVSYLQKLIRYLKQLGFIETLQRFGNLANIYGLTDKAKALLRSKKRILQSLKKPRKCDNLNKVSCKKSAGQSAGQIASDTNYINTTNTSPPNPPPKTLKREASAQKPMGVILKSIENAPERVKRQVIETYEAKQKVEVIRKPIAYVKALLNHFTEKLKMTKEALPASEAILKQRKAKEIDEWAMKQAELNAQKRGLSRDTGNYDDIRKYDSWVNMEVIRLRKAAWDKVNSHNNSSEATEKREWQKAYD